MADDRKVKLSFMSVMMKIVCFFIINLEEVIMLDAAAAET